MAQAGVCAILASPSQGVKSDSGRRMLRRSSSTSRIGTCSDRSGDIDVRDQPETVSVCWAGGATPLSERGDAVWIFVRRIPGKAASRGIRKTLQHGGDATASELAGQAEGLLDRGGVEPEPA